MYGLVLSLCISFAVALPQGYGPPPQSSGGYGVACGPDEVLHVDGRCVQPVVNRNVFLYAAPQKPPVYTAPPRIPDPKIDYNIVFVRTPEQQDDLDPIVIPPPQQKTLVYVLNREEEDQVQEVIEVPSNPTRPEVFYVNYNEGENVDLPGGIDIQSALASANAQQGKLIKTTGGNKGYGGGSSQPSGSYSPPSSGYN